MTIALRNIFSILVFLAPAIAMAQVLPDPVQYAVTPETPGPNSPVTIEIGGVGSFLGSATITWRKDGAVALSGTGETRYSFTTGNIGKITTIDISISSPTQGSYSKEFVFNPSAVNLVWEANTTVPPFYKGKPLYSAGSPLRVIALPVVYQGSSRVAASSLTYQWSVNGEPATSVSGLGRSSMGFTGDELHTSEDVTVDVYYGAAKVAHGEAVIPAVQPQLALYQRDPLRGLILDTAFPQTIALLGKEITVQAVPYYFSVPDFSSGSTAYSWQINGEDASGPDSAQGIITLRQTGSGQGAAQVGVTLQNNNQNAFVQVASAALTLVFGSAPSGLSNLFGL